MTTEAPGFIDKRFIDIKTKSGRTIKVHAPLEESPEEKPVQEATEKAVKPVDSNKQPASLVDIYFIPDVNRKKPVIERIGQYPSQRSGRVRSIDIDSAPIFRDEVESNTPLLSQQHLDSLFALADSKLKPAEVKKPTPEKTIFEAVSPNGKAPIPIRELQEISA